MKEIKLHDRVFTEIVDEASIDRAVSRVASVIGEMYMPTDGRPPLFLVVLDGAFMFAAELLKKLDIIADIKFIKLRSYEGVESTGIISEVLGFTSEDVLDRNVIIIEDIVDTGTTITYLNEKLVRLGANSVAVACLVYKPSKYKGDKFINASGITMDDKFIVGFGLDYCGLGRNLPTIYAEK